PALAFFRSQLAVLWQDDDNHLNLKFAPEPLSSGGDFALGNRIGLGESLAGNASPGLATGGGRLWAAWIDDDDHIFIKSSTNGTDWSAPAPVNESSTDDGTPALTFGNGQLYLAWTGTDDDNHVNVKRISVLKDGVIGPHPAINLSERSSDDAG